MALQWKWTDKMGKAIIRQDERKYEIGIYGGNALAIFISEDKDLYQLYNFITDERHLGIIKENEFKMFYDEVVSIELNVCNKNALKILPLLAKEAGEVRCYYNESE